MKTAKSSCIFVIFICLFATALNAGALPKSGSTPNAISPPKVTANVEMSKLKEKTPSATTSVSTSATSKTIPPTTASTVPTKSGSNVIVGAEKPGITVTSRKSWGTKLKEAFYLCILGTVMFIFSFPALWYNERRKVRTDKIINDAYKVTREVSCQNISQENDMSLVYTLGNLANEDSVLDDLTNISTLNSVKLVRKVEMFQWEESKSTRSRRDVFGGGETTKTTYTYKMVWSDKEIDSSLFQDQSKRNPAAISWVCRSQTFLANQVSLGAFFLSNTQKERHSANETYALTEDCLNKFSSEMQHNISQSGFNFASNTFVKDNYIFLKTEGKTQDSLGDIRISYKYGPCKQVSLVSMQRGTSFQPYAVENLKHKDLKIDKNLLAYQNLSENKEEDACCTCCVCCNVANKLCQAPSEIDWFYEKILTKTQLFNEEKSKNNKITWLYRLGGYLCMLFGIYLFFSPVYEFLQILPLLSTIGSAVGFIFAIIVSTPLTILTISLAWLFYRPVIGVILILLTVPFIYLIIRISTGQSQEQPSDSSEAVAPQVEAAATAASMLVETAKKFL